MTKEEQHQFVRENWQNMTDNEMAKKLNKSRHTITNIRVRLGISKKKNPLSKKQEKEIIKKIGFYSVKNIAEKYNVPNYIIYSLLKREKVKPSESKTYDIIEYKFKEMGYNSIIEAREKLGHWEWKRLIKQFKNQKS